MFFKAPRTMVGIRTVDLGYSATVDSCQSAGGVRSDQPLAGSWDRDDLLELAPSSLLVPPFQHSLLTVARPTSRPSSGPSPPSCSEKVRDRQRGRELGR